MSEQNVESIRGQYTAAARGEMPSLRWLDERIGAEHRWASEPPDMPEPIDQPRWRPERFIDLHGRVLVRVRLSGVLKGNWPRKRRADSPIFGPSGTAHAVELAVYHDWESGLAAAGVAE